ncbi:MAG: ABC transporter ATP-binding protein [Eubacteriales bacterium]|jgi:ATP-binding cassette subfamily B protein|nr:ABC transporter ATP-binding protein [Eubacteriales bacterium]MDD4105014.1 ABC transporter ATP-binding protein [Eubacteriales bacterium]MDD4710614.1 ABC transporter ATP-binding protein [Eubacteriales bacterium]NLO14515.1 ABC transporter ATP-binding protein [Clostridiales bacterium]
MNRGPGGPHGQLHEKPKDFRSSLKRLIANLKPYRIQLIVAILLSTGTSLAQIFGPRMMGQATTVIFEGLVQKVRGQGGIDFARIGQTLLWLFFLYLASTLARLVQGWLMARVTTDFGYKLREKMGDKIHRMPMRYFEGHATGDIMSRISNDVDAVSSNLSDSVTEAISGLTMLVGVTIMMFSISWQMTLLALLVIPLSGVVMGIVMGKSRKYFKQQQESIGGITAQVEEGFSGHQIIKAFSREEVARAAFHETSEKLYNSGWKSAFLSGLMFPIINFVTNLSYVVTVVSGSILASRGAIQVGDILAFTQYVRLFTQPILRFAQMSSIFQRMLAAAERVFEFLDEEEEKDESDLAPFKPHEGDVAFDHISFGYDKDKPVINDFSASIRQGQVAALVGPTGAGKTTIVKLLMRFYDVDSGQILIDGRNVNTIKRQELRQMFGMVLQDTWLFNGTIMENIRYSRPEATDEQVIAAAKAAHADHFIRTLPDGYKLVLNEQADNISQGQKQLLTIARAILADKPILILDEATSNVDTLTEQRIQRAMSALVKGRTSFVIAHRLSTIREADVILVMRDGDIVEQGRHEDLLDAGGFYAELYNSQFDAVD